MRRTTQELFSSSDARAAILSSNEELRGLAAETIHVADGATRSDRDFEPLRAHAKDLCVAVAAHMDFEERILATALSDVIGWGSALRAQIEEDHERQRATVALALSALEPDSVSIGRLIERVRAFADSLLVDLESEERYLLTADLDALSIDSHGG
ncbi:MAG TPA: hypothetical protein VH853_12610 [Polyangia bacterium]|jgi:hypothetical protein|nr:hypothetical protein [Polyangia bacterium]